MNEMVLVMRQRMPETKLRCRSSGQPSRARESPMSIAVLIVKKTCIETCSTLAHGPMALRCQ